MTTEQKAKAAICGRKRQRLCRAIKIKDGATTVAPVLFVHICWNVIVAAVMIWQGYNIDDLGLLVMFGFWSLVLLILSFGHIGDMCHRHEQTVWLIVPPEACFVGLAATTLYFVIAVLVLSTPFFAMLGFSVWVCFGQDWLSRPGLDLGGDYLLRVVAHEAAIVPWEW